MGKVHELAGEQLNPIDSDILEISHESAPSSGIFSSLRLTLGTLKTYFSDFIDSYVYGLKITKQPVIKGVEEYVTYQYQMERYEVVQQIILKSAAAGVMFYITDYNDTDIYNNFDGGGNIFNLGIYSEEITAANRVLNLYVDKSCTIVIISNNNIA